MNKIVSIVVLGLILSGCTTNGVYDSGKTWILVGGIVVGSVALSQSNDDPVEKENCFLHMNSNGDTSTVCR